MLSLSSKLKRWVVSLVVVTTVALPACAAQSDALPPQAFEDWAVVNTDDVDTYKRYCAYVYNEDVCRNTSSDQNVKIVTDKKFGDIPDGLANHATGHLLNQFAQGNYPTSNTEERNVLESAVRFNGDPTLDLTANKAIVIYKWLVYTNNRLKTPLVLPTPPQGYPTAVSSTPASSVS